MPLRTVQSKYFNTDTKYTFTINPNDELQFYKERQLSSRVGKCLFNTLYYLRQYCKDTAEFDLTIEVSLPIESKSCATGPRIHWHGTIKFSDPMTFLLMSYHRLKDKFIFEIDTIENATTWTKYRNKDKGLFKPLMEKLEYPYTINNDTPLIEIHLLSENRKVTEEQKHPLYQTANILKYH